ncbi:MAG: molybdopterin converting factor subunit 1 [Gemmatimonadetes bacterium]|uniref:Molybdopterin synthase sulfur carrier subunit n=1 Tax=Candidatus Kutchimonas denitrificans TaxID=3056748 RepID=A0AAE4ZAK0_9BACT|nr:molybdopterin converting factor subunit 1 [Gemmatimonadota bacterium]NIR75201.1 molybdopterin converting factor subunit 1 [Candidatus Kutchimonas denitrificans]NIS00139.1 molybdopterin converting factor subunit 1 [Gemmatimonadota bacterium]NIT65731.1 molybdopterin converting factor subunit 1 [Gemmatimonadota bacterium]NIU53009.1 molybdopterin converting factor subunit 1 [Gemmatimonadota bacterium]
MRVTVLFFALCRDAAGTDTLDLDLPEAADVSALLDAVRERFGPDAAPDNVAVAVNQEYQDRDTVLEEGDQVALIPPVAGG